jgi:predicted metal-dependent hydrolase
MSRHLLLHEVVKPHGFVLDFVGIFDKLEKALAFDSDEVSGVVKDLQLLKVLFRNKMEQKAPEYLSLIARRFNDRDVDSLIEHFRDPSRRKEFGIPINERTVEYIAAHKGGDANKIINLVKSIEKKAEEESGDPYLIAMAERARELYKKALRTARKAPLRRLPGC